MIFVLIVCGVIIVALLAVIIDLRNDCKCMTEMYHSSKADHDQVLDKWKETIDKWDAALKYWDEATGLNKELRNDIFDFDHRISSLEKNYALHIIGDNDVQKICPVTKVPCSECMPGGPCAVEEKKQ